MFNEYGVINPKEYIHVASSGMINEYTEEFNSLIISAINRNKSVCYIDKTKEDCSLYDFLISSLHLSRKSFADYEFEVFDNFIAVTW